MRIIVVLISAFFLSIFCNLAHADNFYQNTKKNLEDKGLSLDLSSSFEFWTNVNGDLLSAESYAVDFTLGLTLDTYSAGWWDGGTFYLGLSQGSDKIKLSGDLSGMIEEITNLKTTGAVELDELWYEYVIISNVSSVLVGFIDQSLDFHLISTGDLFINGAFENNTEIPLGFTRSVFPDSSLGVRFKLFPNDQWGFLFGIYDGDAEEQNDNTELKRLDFSFSGDAFLISEVEYFFQEEERNFMPESVTSGFWYNTGNFSKLDPQADAMRDGVYGGYFIIDYKLFHENDTDDQGLYGFVDTGGTPNDINEVNYYVNGGIVYQGLIPGRDYDEVGLAIAYASLNDKLARLDTRDKNKTVIEMTYSASINNYVSVQPCLQYILNPGAMTAIEDALIVGLSIDIDL